MSEDGDRGFPGRKPRDGRTGDSGAPEGRRVVVVFKRVQTFLFASSQLRDMVGANVLIGETLRRDLFHLALDCGCAPLGSLPADLAFDHGDDPLEQTDVAEEYRDRPADLIADGILNRDGGRFNATFPDETSAARFVRAVHSSMAQRLPGLPYVVGTHLFPHSDHEGKDRDRAPLPHSLRSTKMLGDLPVFRVCEASGNGAASTFDAGRQEWVSGPIELRRQARRRFVDAQTRTCDMVGLLRERLPLSDIEPAPDFERLCGEGHYLALVHADGNAMGKRVREWQSRCGFHTGSLAREAATERFFYGMRVALRGALCAALADTYSADLGRSCGYRPYQILMLGGDDLLLACRASDALPLVERLCRELDAQGREQADGEALTLGIGVALARPSFPMHRLHGVAESLAASAKRLDRQRKRAGLPRRSIVDWQVVTASWTDDPIAERRRNAFLEIAGEALALSSKPYLAFDPDQPGSLGTLSGLLAAAAGIAASPAARSQWQRLALELRLGRLWGELRMRELAEETRTAFEAAGIASPWTEVVPPAGAADGRRYWTTRLPDLIELLEIPRLGRRAVARTVTED